ncbi:MAG TPA: helicase-related protein, partial [Myxococcaceae bacterium]
VLVLCKSSLLRKWQEEMSSTREGRGFPQYLTGEGWRGHPIHSLLKAVRVVSHRESATALRQSGIRGTQEGGTIQVPSGIWVVNHDVLSERVRNGPVSRPLLRQLWNTRWDLIIVDEAHHYAHWNQPSYLFAPDGDMRNYDQGISGGTFRHLLALTATPFELTPRELVTLLALIRADSDELDQIDKGLELYVDQLDRFFGLRQRSPEDRLRRESVERLRRLREEEALDTGKKGAGLQALLRRYIIRNTKHQNERRYFLVNKTAEGYAKQRFDKLDDLNKSLRSSALLPFDGVDALFYLELRELIQETIDRAREGDDHRTFITTDLRQGLSSYPQIAQSALLGRDLVAARRLKGLVEQWNQPESLHLHPKVRALADVVAEIAREEVAKVQRNPTSWFSKVLVFNKLIGGTARQLREQLELALTPVFEEFLADQLRQRGVGDKNELAKRFRTISRKILEAMKEELARWRPGHHLIPEQFTHQEFSSRRGEHLMDVYLETLVHKVSQTLLLIDAVLSDSIGSDAAIEAWLRRTLLEPFEQTLRNIIDHYLDDEPGESVEDATRFEQGEREALSLLEECHNGELVGRYDGDNSRDREAHRRNFNRRYNPFALLVSRVGEEGIDLQEQCRYVIHYDLEWNPAKMEQREGRVDRMKWGRANEGFIDVRFLLLKGTYEERIFHTVMQRDQWFQVLIGSKRRELGRLEEEASGGDVGDPTPETIIDERDQGRLTPEEKSAVMIDLKP